MPSLQSRCLYSIAPVTVALYTPGAGAHLLRVDPGVLGKILPDVVVPRTHLAACSAVGGGLPGAKTQIGDFRQLPT